MAFQPRSFDTPIIVLGDGPGEQSEVTGKLVSICPSPRFPDRNKLYSVQLVDGTTVAVAGCVCVNSALTPADIGRVIRVRFIRWDQNQSGVSYKVVRG